MLFSSEFQNFWQNVSIGKYSLKVSKLGCSELWTLVEDCLHDYDLSRPHKIRKENMEKSRKKEFEEYKNKMIEWAKWKLEQHYRYNIFMSGLSKQTGNNYLQTRLVFLRTNNQRTT